MTPLRRAAALTAPVLLALSLTACGGGDGGGGGGGGGNEDVAAADAPTDASEGDFCGVFDEFESRGEDIDEEDNEAVVDFLNDVADELKGVGTPENMPQDARDGFEVVVDTWSDLQPSDVEGDAADNLGLSDSDQETAGAFLEYAGTTCDLDE